ncbi:hypothetical protein [Halorhodospira halochloris]|uniref:hypothetical protein n=1 Tax=Halorhodospira halochloris TaxID=1052 RepID=UPI001EE829B0|nr:hypothetical protein [Halorhodospira halochloris]MCG5547658.1 hypothetical protein [Halorhodospira halochloris]
MTSDSDYELYRPVIESLRAMAAAFAEPILAPADAEADGVALRPPQLGEYNWTMALTTTDGCPIEIEIDPQSLLNAQAHTAAPSAAQALYETIVQETGAHRSERQTLIVTTRKDPGPTEIFAAYRRRLG